MTTSSQSDQPPTLIPLATLSSPAGRGTRAWSSTPHSSPSTPLLATASSDKSVHIWSLRDFRLLSTISGGHKRSVRCVDWKDYGRGNAAGSKAKEKPATLATGSFDANVGIWVHNDKNERQEAADLEEMDIMKSEREGGNDEDEEWHFSTLLTGPDSEIKSLAFSPSHYSANMLATSSRDKSVWVWEEVEDDEWETIAVLAEHAGDVKCVAWCEGARKRRKMSRDHDEVDDPEEENDLVGRRELLASGSYDDTIRLWRDIEEEGDWGCVGVIEGHNGTVWDLSWEKWINHDLPSPSSHDSDINLWDSRLISCSDDMTIRVWKKEYSVAEREKRKQQNTSAPPTQRLPSIIKPTSTMELWTQDSQLPAVHVRSIYAVDWSRQTGLVVSCAGDGTIAVYKEVPENDREDVVMNGTEEHGDAEDGGNRKNTWVVVALLESAHDEYEVNHVCWASRRDKNRRSENEEIVVSTADDGDVRFWCLPEGLV